jgi:PAS domain-containing protein
VIVTNERGEVTFMNRVAAGLTGWEPQEAAGQPLERVFRIINEQSRQPVENPVSKVIRERAVVGGSGAEFPARLTRFASRCPHVPALAPHCWRPP